MSPAPKSSLRQNRSVAENLSHAVSFLCAHRYERPSTILNSQPRTRAPTQNESKAFGTMKLRRVNRSTSGLSSGAMTDCS